jgi:hypothetical protein
MFSKRSRSMSAKESSCLLSVAVIAKGANAPECRILRDGEQTQADADALVVNAGSWRRSRGSKSRTSPSSSAHQRRAREHERHERRTSERLLAMCTDGMSAAGDTAVRCRLCPPCHGAVCAQSDIKRVIACDRVHIPANACDAGARIRCVLRRPRSFLHVASALQPRHARRCPAGKPRILAFQKENCWMRERGQHTHAASLQLNRYRSGAVVRCRRNGRRSRGGTSPWIFR